MPITLSHKDVVILGSAINFRLYVMEEDGVPDHTLTIENRQSLRILSNEFSFQSQAFTYHIKELCLAIDTVYVCEDGFMRLPASYYHLLCNILDLMASKLLGNSEELEVLTGASVEQFDELRTRLYVAASL